LFITSESGCKDTARQVVTIHPNPLALFGYSPLYGEAPLEITFNNQSVGAATYVWDFGDGNGSLVRNPIYTYQYNDTFDVSLRVYSDSGCADSFSRTIIVIPTQLDISLDEVSVDQTPQSSGHVSVSITVTMTNQGSRLIRSANLYAIVGGGSVISESWTDSMPPGAQRQYTFTASLISSAAEAGSYVCVNATDVNGGEAESRLDNNRVCTTLNGSIQLVGPLPNPVSDRAVLGIIMPKAGKVSIAIVDVAGQYVTEEIELSLGAGRSDFEIPAHKMSAAEYFIRVKYNDDNFVRKFVIKR
jgi:PKD repeat protein